VISAPVLASNPRRPKVLRVLARDGDFDDPVAVQIDKGIHVADVTTIVWRDDVAPQDVERVSVALQHGHFSLINGWLRRSIEHAQDLIARRAVHIVSAAAVTLGPGAEWGGTGERCSRRAIEQVKCVLIAVDDLERRCAIDIDEREGTVAAARGVGQIPERSGAGEALCKTHCEACVAADRSATRTFLGDQIVQAIPVEIPDDRASERAHLSCGLSPLDHAGVGMENDDSALRVHDDVILLVAVQVADTQDLLVPARRRLPHDVIVGPLRNDAPSAQVDELGRAVAVYIVRQ
jgi:hypothetical protein